jgi:hypothetical protein
MSQKPVEMKTAFKILFCLAMFMGIQPGLNAQAYITLQHGSEVSMYTKLDSAIVHAQDNDYIYMPGGSFTLNTNINKRLYIYGAGHYPDSTANTGVTKITSFVYFITGADSGLVSGIYFAGSIAFGTTAANQEVNGYSIMRCRVDGNIYLSYNGSTNTTSSGFYIAENVLSSVIGGYASDVYIEKNIFSMVIQYFDGAILKNNIFLYSHNTNSTFGLTNVNWVVNCLMENNIVFDINPLQNGTSYTPNCVYNHNIFVDPNVIIPIGTVTGEGNYTGITQSSIFINQSGNSFNYAHDYHLKPTCPGVNGGTDGTDVGIYGTGTPYKDGAVPVNPHIRYKAITSDNNTINVNIKVAAQDR